MALSKIQNSSMADNTIHGRRNIIINGAMQVAQRGTSFTGVGDGDNAYYIDRFEFVESGSPNGVFTLSQSSTSPDGFGNSLKFDCTTAESSLASNEQIRLRQKIEGQNLQQFKKGTSNAEKMTVSFYVRSNLTGTAIVNLYDGDNNRHTAKSYTIDSANTWERKTITFDGDTTGAFDDDNATSLDVIFYLQAGANFSSGTLATTWASHNDVNSAVGQTINIASSTDNEFFITGIQLEVGSQATPFEHRSFGEELALCQRYFYKHDINSSSGPRACTYHNSYKMIHDFFPTTMRVFPTATATFNASFTGDTPSTNVGKFYVLSANNSNHNYFMQTGQYDSEL